MYNLQITAKRIKELCDKHNISVNKMLTESGAGARTYHNILAGSHPSTDKASKIADYLDCSVDYLLGRTDNPEINRYYNEGREYEIAAFKTHKHIDVEDID